MLRASVAQGSNDRLGPFRNAWTDELQKGSWGLAVAQRRALAQGLHSQLARLGNEGQVAPQNEQASTIPPVFVRRSETPLLLKMPMTDLRIVNPRHYIEWI